MSPRIIVVPSKISDVYRLCAMMRDRDRDEALALGVDPKRAMRAQFRAAVQRKTYFVDGKIVAMSGLCGPLLANVGNPYLVTAKGVERFPVAIVRHARAAVDQMLMLRQRLEGYVLADYTGAVRLLEVVGFTLDPPQPLGPTGAMFCKFWKERG